jgi:hypothetical protein
LALEAALEHLAEDEAVEDKATRRARAMLDVLEAVE